MADQSSFTSGSTMTHVVVMTTTSTVGLMTLFVVDLADMYFLSLLGELELAAAIGYAGTILFFTTSISIGIAIASGALVSRSIGQQNHVQAKRYTTNVLVYGVLFAVIISIGIWLIVPYLLNLLGASGKSKQLATDYLRIIIPSMSLLVIAMAGTGVLRAKGDAKRSMYATISGGLVNAVLDPIFIFTLAMGIKGAALASVIARLVVMIVAINGITRSHQLVGRFSIAEFFEDFSDISRIAIPAVLTNIATPLGNAYVIATMARFGDSAVAAMSVIGRVIPVAFAIVFALSGAVGPIVGQNFGARLLPRVRDTLRDGIVFCTIVVSAVSVVLFTLQDFIVTGFSLSGEARIIVNLFCTWIAFSFVFNGYQFIANAAFNNLGYAHYATMFNFSKATLGTVPFVYIGSELADASGVLIGQAIGTVLIGSIAIIVSFRLVAAFDQGQGPGPVEKPFNPRITLWPQSNIRG